MKYYQYPLWRAFLKECVDNPYDATPRLVLCDWLEGECPDRPAGTLRAECIRVQLALNAQRRGECKPSPENDKEQDRLERRESELLQTYGRAWLCGELGLAEIEVGLRQKVVMGCPRHAHCLANLSDYGAAVWAGGFVGYWRQPSAGLFDPTSLARGYAQKVVRAHPLLGVQVTGLPPSYHAWRALSEPCQWCLETTARRGAGRLPPEIWAHLPRLRCWGTWGGNGTAIGYRTKTHAGAALARACLNHLREWAGLSLVPPETGAPNSRGVAYLP